MQIADFKGKVRLEINKQFLEMNWIKQRLNEDNFWNLVFWASPTFGLATFIGFSELPTAVSGILCWSSLLILPYIATRASKVTRNSENIFVNKRGIPLNNRYPKALGKVIWATIIFGAMNVFFISAIAQYLHPFFTYFFLVGNILIVPVSYFIYKNCPISILFNKHARCEEVTGIIPSKYRPAPYTYSVNSFSSPYSSSGSTCSPQAWYRDPARANLPGNIYHHHRR